MWAKKLKIKDEYKIHISRFIKFAVVGGIGAAITFSLTWLLTDKFHLYYLLSMVFAVAVATVSNFALNTIWTFATDKKMDDEDYEWNAYYKGNFIQKWWKHKIKDSVLSMLPKQTDLDILDFGCGSSPLAFEIGSKNYMGIDSNQKKIQYMKSKMSPYRYETINYMGGHKVEAVLAIEVIEHMPSYVKAQEFVSMLSGSVCHGGTVIIATPDYDKRLWRIVEKLYGLLMPSAYADDHKAKFTEKLLIANCRTVGLRHIQTQRVLGCDMVCQFIKRG